MRSEKIDRVCFSDPCYLCSKTIYRCQIHTDNGEVPRDAEELKQWAGDQQRSNGAIQDLTRKFTSWSASVTGTPQYWWKRAGELKAFVNHMLSHGETSPLFFHSGSAAEYYWPSLHKLFNTYFEKRGNRKYAEATGYLARGEKVPKHLKHTVHKAIIEHPQIINQYFTLRTETWFKTFLKDVFGVDE